MDPAARGKTAAQLAGVEPGDPAGPLLKAQTLPIMNAKVTPGGHVVITCNKINKQGSMHRIHYAEGNWSGSQLPMDRFF